MFAPTCAKSTTSTSLNSAGADVVGLRAEQLLGDAGPELERPRQMLLLHDLLDRERRRDLQRHAGVVSFAVARRALDHRLVLRDARLLRRLRDAVDVGAQRDDRLARSPGRHPRRRNAGDASPARVKPFFFRIAVRYFEVSNSWNPSSAKLKTESFHCCDVLLHAVDLEADVPLVLFEFAGWAQEPLRVAEAAPQTASR